MKIKTTLIEALRQWPSIFDQTRFFSRLAGRHDRLYLVLKAKLPELGPDFTFLQAGAHDGLRNDPFREFIIASPKGRGILVEPWPTYFHRLRSNYHRYAGRLSFFRSVITYPPREMLFYSFTEDFVKRHHLDPILLSTAALDPAHLHKQVRNTLLDENSIATLRVPGHTVEQLMRLAGFDRIDALFLDLEGHESNVLLNLDFQTVRPRLVVFESKHVGVEGSRVDEHLRGYGFDLFPCDDDTLAFRPVPW